MKQDRKEKVNFPNLRFPGFQGEWKTRTLGECVKSLDYGMNASATEYDGENKYIRITDIDEMSSRYISENSVSPKGKLLDKYLVKENDILFARTGASTGKTYIYNKEDGKLYFAGFLIRARIKSELNAFFIFNQTQTVRYDKWVKLTSMRSGQPGINSQEYASYKFYLPEKQEQEKIAIFLSLLDDRISTQNKIIEDLESLQKGIRKYVFSNLKATKSVKLGDLCNITTGKLDANAMMENGSYKFFTCAEETYLINTYAFDTEALLISGNGANVGYIHYYNGKFNAYQRTYVLDKFQCNIQYVKYYLQTMLHKRIEQEKNMGNTPYIVLSTLSDMIIKLPTEQEQENIAKNLSFIDEKLETEKQLLKKYTEQKKYLLTNMFV